MLYPQNGDSIVATDSVTSFHPMYNKHMYVGLPYSRTKSYAAIMSCGGSSYWSLSAAGPRRTSAANPPDAAAGDWRDRQTDVDRFIMPAADWCGPRNKAMNVALQAPPQAGTLFTMYPSSLDRRPLSSTTARNRYDAAAALACAQRRDDVTRCNGIDMFL